MNDVKVFVRDDSIKLGDEARDQISGFQGTVTAITEWLNGCRRITVTPAALFEGNPVNNQTFDAEQLVLVKPYVIPDAIPTGGDREDIERPADIAR